MKATMARSRISSGFSGMAPSISRRRGTGKNQSNVPMILLAVGALTVAVIGLSFMGIYSMMHLSTEPAVSFQSQRVSKSDAKRIIQKVKDDFTARYGERYSQILLEKGVEAFGSIDATASRMVDASENGRPFVMAFSGYSVTVGRGNFFNQSFPFEVQRILDEPMKKLLGIPAVVRNAAIGGIPSFPYGFCLEHFVGSDPDVLSWDYSMNEGKGAAALEAFVRQSMQQLPKRPMLLMMDKNVKRANILKDYTSKGLLHDAITVGMKETVLDDETFQQDPLPVGFQDWDEFGAPKACPGRNSWHPRKQEHAMVGWMIAMHFVTVLERAYEMRGQALRTKKIAKGPLEFPKPSSATKGNDPEVSELLFGHPQNGGDSYVMKDLSCRTSFVPATDTSKTLPSIVVSGFAEADMDIMLDRTEEHYKEGWVLDVSKVERDTKKKVQRCGGLGYVDMKIAMYGIPDSGKLRLWLPFEGPSHDDHSHHKGDMDAKHWFDDLIVCEANEKRPETACKLDEDIEFVVGGVTVSSITPVHEAAEYLKRKTCVNVGIPAGAKVIALKDVQTTEGKSLSKADRRRLASHDDAVGVVVDVSARSKVTLGGGACCLSHVVWEMH